MDKEEQPTKSGHIYVPPNTISSILQQQQSSNLSNSELGSCFGSCIKSYKPQDLPYSYSSNYNLGNCFF